MKLYRPYIQKGWLGSGDYRFGFIIDLRSSERMPTVDICFWWVWFMIYWGRWNWRKTLKLKSKE